MLAGQDPADLGQSYLALPGNSPGGAVSEESCLHGRDERMDPCMESDARGSNGSRSPEI